MPTRFLLVSTHTEQMTGYSKVSYNLLKQIGSLSPLVKTFHFGFQKSVAKAPKAIRPLPEGIVQYDAALNEDPREEGFGFNKFKEYVDTVSPDIIMIYNDALVINRFLESLKLKEDSPKPPFKIWVYLDQVYKNAAPALIHNIEKHADHIFTFTENWKKHLLTILENPEEAKVDSFEHGIDKMIFKPLSSQERGAIRSGMGIPLNAKVFLNVNRNSERKRLDLSLMAFVELMARHPDDPYNAVFVTTARPEAGGHYDIQGMYVNELKMRGMDVEKYIKRVTVIDNGPPNILSDESINHIYNACDYGVNTSNGEGFGLCQLEHLATGAIQIVVDVGDYRAFMDETCAVFVPPSQRAYLPCRFGLGLCAETCTVTEFADGMEKAMTLNNSKCADKVSKRTWSKVCDPFLEMVAQSYVKN